MRSASRTTSALRTRSRMMEMPWIGGFGGMTHPPFLTQPPLTGPHESLHSADQSRPMTSGSSPAVTRFCSTLTDAAAHAAVAGRDGEPEGGEEQDREKQYGAGSHDSWPRSVRQDHNV